MYRDVYHTRVIRFTAWAMAVGVEGLKSEGREDFGIVPSCEVESSELCHRNGGADPWRAQTY